MIKTRARTNNILTIEDAIKSHPMLSKRQKDELITGFNKFTDEACKAVFAEYTERFDKELSAMSLLVLHNEFGFGEERLGRFAKLFGNLMEASFKTERNGNCCRERMLSRFKELISAAR